MVKLLDKCSHRKTILDIATQTHIRDFLTITNMDFIILFFLGTISTMSLAQDTRDPRFSSTDGRLSCLEDTFVRLESYGTSMRKRMGDIEGKFINILSNLE